MSEFSVLGRFVNFDVDTRNLVLSMDFLDQDTQRNIEQAVMEGKQTKIIFKLKFNQTQKGRYQRCWYGSLEKIMKSDQYQMAPVAENMDALDDYLRESIFPARKLYIGGVEVISVSRMRHLSEDQLQICINKLHERYSYLTINKQPIDFSDLKG